MKEEYITEFNDPESVTVVLDDEVVVDTEVIITDDDEVIIEDDEVVGYLTPLKKPSKVKFDFEREEALLDFLNYRRIEA